MFKENFAFGSTWIIFLVKLNHYKFNLWASSLSILCAAFMSAAVENVGTILTVI